MSVRQLAVLLGAVALVGGAATAAQAADVQARPVDFTVRPDNAAAPAGQPKSYRFEGHRGKFGVTLDMQQPETRPGAWNDIQAGAFYRITPSIRVGGAVALGAQQLQQIPVKPVPETGQPRVRFETQFKF
jgi:hypothetical protein